MAIYTDRILMDIHRMIRKGSVQFEPGDRIPIKFNSKGKETTLYLGSVYFDTNNYKVCYDLFDHDNGALPVATIMPRDIEKLSAGDLLAVANKLDEYERDSFLRHSNYKSIEDELGKTDTQSIDFDETNRPIVLVDLNTRMAKDSYASLEECKVKSLFMGKNECFVTVKNEHGEEKNVKLAMFNDRSIMNITSCLKNRQLQNKVADKVREKTQITPKGL